MASGDGGACAPSTTGAPSFATIYTSIISTNCTTHHSGSNASGGLDMSSQTKAFTNLTTGTSSESGCSEHYVVPCNATSSLLYQKVSGMSIPSACGARMPEGGPYLSSTNITAIQDWINQGAAK
jgi:hypothetical protein